MSSWRNRYIFLEIEPRDKSVTSKMATEHALAKSEELLGERWDQCLTDAAIKMGVGFGVGKDQNNKTRTRKGLFIIDNREGLNFLERQASGENYNFP